MTPRSLRSQIRTVTQSRSSILGDVRLEGIARHAASYTRVTVSGPVVGQIDEMHPADAIRLLVPPHGTDAAPGHHVTDDPTSVPSRALTISEASPERGVLSVDLLRHGAGYLHDWLADATVGDRLGVAGLRCEFVRPDAPRSFLVVADASALPAAAQIIADIGPHRSVTAVLHAADPADRALVPAWLDPLWVRADELVSTVAGRSGHDSMDCAWVAGERDATRAVRRVALAHLGVPRDQLQASAYWVAGRDTSELDAERSARYAQAAEQGEDLADPTVLERIELLDENTAGAPAPRGLPHDAEG